MEEKVEPRCRRLYASRAIASYQDYIYVRTLWQYRENNIMLLHVRSIKRVMAVFYIYAATRALTPHIPCSTFL